MPRFLAPSILRFLMAKQTEYNTYMHH